MADNKSKKGLQSSFRISKRCSRCDFPLEHSLFKNQSIVFCIGRAQYLCIDCSLKPTKSNKNRVTIDELDAFLKKKIGEVFH